MKTSLASILVVLAFTGAALAAGVSFSARDGWIRAAPEGARSMAGYVQLGNDGEQTLRIVDASSAAFEAVAFHESYEDEGLARMRAITALEVPAKGSLGLAPGGLHLMLLRPTRPIAEGANIVVDLITEEGDPLPVVLQVRRAPADSGHAHHGH